MSEWANPIDTSRWQPNEMQTTPSAAEGQAPET